MNVGTDKLCGIGRKWKCTVSDFLLKCLHRSEYETLHDT